MGKWLKNVLRKSTADYLFVAGHYPVYSVCSHGPTRHLVDHVQPLLEKYDVTGFLSGHDHCQSFVQNGDNPVIPKNSVKYYLTRKHNPNHSRAGFGAYHMDSKKVELTFYNEKGDALFTTSKKRRRSRKTNVEKPDGVLK